MKQYCNFEYETHLNKDRVYVRGNLTSITNKPRYDVFTNDICAWSKVLNERDVHKTSENIEFNEGYSISVENLEEVDDEY